MQELWSVSLKLIVVVVSTLLSLLAVLLKPMDVQLSHEAFGVVMLEVGRQDLATKFVVINY